MKNFNMLIFACLFVGLQGGRSERIDNFKSGMPLRLDPSFAIVSQSVRPESAWDFELCVAFNEYQAIQDSMEVAFSSSQSDGFYPTNTVPEGKISVLDFDYHPGFRVGFVVNTPYDDWDFGGEYLWYRGTSSVSKQGTKGVYYSSPIFVSPFDILIGSFNADWRLGIDMIDLYLSRPYFSGHQITITPFMGLRNAWVRGQFTLSATNFSAPSNRQTAKTNSQVWMFGPNLGFVGNYWVGKGFSLFGTLGTSFLYTQYNSVNLHYLNYLGESSQARNDGFDTFRSILDTAIGVNWESSTKYKVRVNIAYDLDIFFAQNMERTLVSIAGGEQATPGNLYLSGVSIGASVVF